MPHGISVDNNNNIWVTDVALHQVSVHDDVGMSIYVDCNESGK